MANLLIVDDELGMRQFLTHLFQREGHIVRVAENGHAALEQIRQLAPDLIVEILRAAKVRVLVTLAPFPGAELWSKLAPHLSALSELRVSHWSTL